MISDVAVIGAGTMGEGIAQVAASSGHRVLLFDSQPTEARNAIEAIANRLHASVEKGRRELAEVELMLSRISIATSLDEMGESDLVIEAIVEDLEAKRVLVGQLEEKVRPDAIIASNTSSISITDIASGAQYPERIVGIHFFNPAPVMDLVEIVSGDKTGTEISQACYELAAAWNKKPVMCRSTPGFIGNYVNRPFYLEGLRCREEGLADERTIDAMMTGAAGFRMGPFELMDLVGIDVNLAVSDSVWNALDRDKRFEPSGIQRTLVKLGKLGRKTGAGFYPYRESGAKRAPRTVPPAVATSEIRVGPTAGGLDALVDRAREAGLTVSDGAELDGIEVDDVRLILTDGYTAAEHTRGTPIPCVVVDWAHEPALAAFMGIASGVGNALPVAAGFLDAIGIKPILLGDHAGLVVARTISSIISLAAETVDNGVATADDVDLAMVAGFNYPEGPIAWGRRLGADRIGHVIERLGQSVSSERYYQDPALEKVLAE
jgi:3-hydroxybutyryl-CoA dehydrogenase